MKKVYLHTKGQPSKNNPVKLSPRERSFSPVRHVQTLQGVIKKK